MTVCDTIISDFVPREHLAQFLLQPVVSRFNVTAYLCTGQAGILSASMVHCGIKVLQELKCELQSLTRMLLRLGNVCESVPAFTTDAVCTVQNSGFTFCRVVHTHVIDQGPMEPTLLFHHDLQVFYSKRKGAAEGAYQFLATLNSPGGRAGS